MIYELINTPSNTKTFKDDKGNVINYKDFKFVLTTDCSSDKILKILRQIPNLTLDVVITAIQKAGYHCNRAYNNTSDHIYIDVKTMKIIKQE